MATAKRPSESRPRPSALVRARTADLADEVEAVLGNDAVAALKVRAAVRSLLTEIT